MTLKYRPTTAKYRGKTKTLYIYYESRDRVRGGKVRWKPHVKRVYVSGTVERVERGTFTNRYGRRVHGLKIVYENPRRAFTAHRRGKRYKVRRATVEVTKIVELPSDARNVRIHTKKSEVEPTLMNIL
ncbi:hypothetical protein DRJ19_05490 [Candidatus Woesearchaeota archaeon]|nr:MAG: hypothetical protein DRJ19_05490 [Candidatus Woesearchaeota archaeon]